MKRLWSSLIFLSMIALILPMQACSKPSSARPSYAAENDSNGIPSNPTALPTRTPTPTPLGSDDNPITLGLIAAPLEQQQSEALHQFIAILSENLNLAFDYEVFSGYFDLEQAVLDEHVELVFSGPIEYLIGNQKELINVALVAIHAGVKSYGTQFFANKRSEFQSFFDTSTNTSFADAYTALNQFNGTKPCFISEKSLSGYWLPAGYLRLANLNFQTPIFMGSSAASLRSLYIGGVCDFAATYSSISDPRTASNVINDLPDILDQVPIIWISPPVIPNKAFSFSNELPLSLQSRISEFLLQYAFTAEGRQLLEKALNYEINGVSAVTDSFYDPLRELLKIQSIRFSDLLEQP